jgi:multicomponent Na+:H+ antiporter subunit A
MLVLIAAHLVLGAAIIAAGDRLGRRAFALAGIAPLATLAWLIVRSGGILDGRAVVERRAWAAGLDLRLDLRVDGLAWVMAVLVSGIGVLICAYAISYFAHPKPGTARLAGLLTMFAGAMTALVTADHVMMLFLGWELTSVLSYLLIGNDDREPRARAAALQALLITGSGGLALLAGLVLLGNAAGTYQLSGIVAAAPGGGLVTGGLVCVLAGAFAKSAQQPFGSWLPGAMVAPTPVSAYLHSATMVKAGVYLVARLAPAFATHAPWRVLCVTVGLTTMVVGALRALRQCDLKLILAMSTVSQLGLLVALFGLGIPKVTQAAIVLLVAHAVFKSALFMVVGVVDHATGTRDIRRLRLAGREWRLLHVVAGVGAVSMAGIPPVFGFVAKEAVVEALLATRSAVAGGVVVLVVVAVASAVTVAYSARFLLGLLGWFADDGTAPVHGDGDGHGHGDDHPSLVPFLAPAAVLAAITVVLGLVPGLFDDALGTASAALHPGEVVKHLALWHGLTPALAVSAGIVGGGIALVAARARVARIQATRLPAVSAERGYLAALRGTVGFADRLTAVAQNGSLPIYAGVILVTIAASALVVLVGQAGLPGLPQWVDQPVHVPIAALLVAASIGTAMLRRRFAAVLALGVTGYAMAGLYVAQGAPDLALTQLAIETLSVVLFVLVLRFLPDADRSRAPLPARLLRLGVSAVVGVFVFVFALTMSAVRTAPPVSQEYVARSLTEGKGANVVNVIIVDFRGLDTLGEITVLVVAALGAVTLTRLDRTPRGFDAAKGSA